MTTPPPPTIADLIASLGPPRNYAEQGLLHDLARLEARAWQYQEHSEQHSRLWIEVHAIVTTIHSYRTHGATPVLEGVRFSQ